ncbi:MAG: hypothetical protein A2086_07140 [Spirochaetes bacterium GWD1_27_9]|nr:MAG: hypothetical protein A2Z98_13150 [Spirochaetes bacterium GWB1_27_13]OHD25613.1 MAG: hypothetical protein A2Y34_08575 [Spirochaetes bacterium GWC1_27_15]OHD29133.1 MAG: hypothetical protein A2086_07140 [Spirochaetes bacterium GWD1_27_9]
MVTIWTLNESQKLVFNSDLDNIFGKGNWQLGDRKKYDIPDIKKSDEKHNLMPSQEYFVPIAAKCLGEKINQLDDIKKYFYDRWKYSKLDDRKNYEYDNLWRSFWDIHCGSEEYSKMITKNYLSYYDILKDNPNNILIAYSQGGLVARYLAYLSEYVFNEENKVIKAVITLNSSNFGSPLANTNNAETIIDSAITSFNTLISLYPQDFKHFNKYLQNKIDFKDIYGIFQNLNKDLENFDGNNQTESIKNMKSFVSSLKKWLSGLHNDKDTAFSDLNIFDIDNKNSILETVNNNLPKKIYYGGVASTDNDFKNVFYSLLRGVNFILPGFVRLFIKNMKILDKPLAENVIKFNQIFKDVVMKECDYDVNNAKNKFIKDIIGYYQNGVSLKTFKLNKSELPAKSHDFVMPTAYQLLPNNGQSNFLGNKINDKANHNTGKDINFEGGRINRKYIIEYLKQVKNYII